MSKTMTAKDLIDSGFKPKLPIETLQAEVLSRLKYLREQGVGEEERLQRLFPNTILDTEALKQVLACLLAGSHILLFGPSGSGKTNMAKDIWRLYPKEAYAVEDCPVQCDPFSLVDPQFSKLQQPCPFCKMRHGGVNIAELGDFDPKNVDPATVKVKKVWLREGYGFARIQGSSEVFPDNLTGTINLHKLEEIGDPTSPLILEPGKLLQANRGVLIIDEVGKLPIGTQNVLLQALQEAVVSPAKSRETFPASFIAITTSNIQDLDNINEPLNDRLSSIYIGFPSKHDSNRAIVELALKKNPPTVFTPEIILDGAVNISEAWRRATGREYELSEVGSNRALIDHVYRSQAYAVLANRKAITPEDFFQGVHDTMVGRIRARGGDSFTQNLNIINTFINNNFQRELERAAKRYWCRYYKAELKSNEKEGRRILKAAAQIVAEPKLLNTEDATSKIDGFVKYVMAQEKYAQGASQSAVLLGVFRLLSESLACDKEVEL